MPVDPEKSPYRKPFTCEWIPTEPWNVWRTVQEGTFDQRCREEAPFSVMRPDDCDTNFCAEHLIAFLFLYGPHQVRHWGDFLSVANKRIRGEVRP